jgi:hypothetical protein
VGLFPFPAVELEAEPWISGAELPGPRRDRRAWP